MAVRIECEVEGFEKNWVEFRGDRWPFGDRRAMMDGQTDLESLKVILGYIEGWNMLNVKDKKVVFDPEGGVDLLDTMDEILVNWLIGAWFEARAKREELPKKVS